MVDLGVSIKLSVRVITKKQATCRFKCIKAVVIAVSIIQMLMGSINIWVY